MKEIISGRWPQPCWCICGMDQTWRQHSLLCYCWTWLKKKTNDVLLLLCFCLAWQMNFCLPEHSLFCVRSLPQTGMLWALCGENSPLRYWCRTGRQPWRTWPASERPSTTTWVCNGFQTYHYASTTNPHSRFHFEGLHLETRDMKLFRPFDLYLSFRAKSILTRYKVICIKVNPVNITYALIIHVIKSFNGSRRNMNVKHNCELFYSPEWSWFIVLLSRSLILGFFFGNLLCQL